MQIPRQKDASAGREEHAGGLLVEFEPMGRRNLVLAAGRVGFATATVVAITYQFATLNAT